MNEVLPDLLLSTDRLWNCTIMIKDVCGPSTIDRLDFKPVNLNPIMFIKPLAPQALHLKPLHLLTHHHDQGRAGTPNHKASPLNT